MSCLICRKETIDTLVFVTKQILEDPYNSVPDFTKNEFNDCFVSGSYDAHKLYRKFYIQNCIAYNGRYHDENVKEFPKYTGYVPYTINNDSVHDFGFYIYQISEEPVCNTTFYDACEQLQKEAALRACK